MGLFSRHQSKSAEQNNQRSTEDKAFDYFDDQFIQTMSSSDIATIKRLYKALKEDNYDTSDDSNLVGAISSLDANIYNLSKAIIYQNFMLMRKIDALSRKIDSIADQNNS